MQKKLYNSFLDGLKIDESAKGNQAIRKADEATSYSSRRLKTLRQFIDNGNQSMKDSFLAKKEAPVKSFA